MEKSKPEDVRRWLGELIKKWREGCEATRREMLPGGIREKHQEGPRYGIAAVESCADELEALLASDVGVLPAPAEPHTHDFHEFTICRHCLRTPVDIDDQCHHCDEPQSGKRCFWCLRIIGANPDAKQKG